MTSIDYLKEKLQTATDAVNTVSDLADMVHDVTPENVLESILPNSGDNIETGEVFDMITGLTDSVTKLLNILTYDILSDVSGISALDQVDFAEAEIINALDDSESAYPFAPDKYKLEKSER